jgi:hypothetical protein
MARSAILQVVDPVEAEVPRRAQLTDRTALELFAPRARTAPRRQARPTHPAWQPVLRASDGRLDGAGSGGPAPLQPLAAARAGPYPAISEFLASWTRARDAPAVPVRIVGQAVIIATGVSCHRLEALVGAGVFNGTGAAEARRSAGNTSSSRPLTRPPGGATPRPVRLLCHHAGPRCCARRQDGRSPCDRHPPARPPSAFSWAPK